MKKWGLIFGVVVIIVLACIYLFIPSTLIIKRLHPANVRWGAAVPVISSDSSLQRWWPAGGGAYHLDKVYYSYVDIDIRTEKQELRSRLSILPLMNRDSSVLQWECSMAAGMNPFVRIQRYWEAKEIALHLDSLLSTLRAYVEDRKNIYGAIILEGSTSDSTLVVTRTTLPHYPTTADVYAQLDKEMAYIAGVGAKPSGGYPMMNVTPAGDKQDSFHLMVALPIDRRIPAAGEFRFLRLVPGHYLIADVEGGPHAIATALNGMENYIRDYQRSIMAVPFQSLITNRSVQTDTNRWKTRIYYPIQ